MCSNSSHKSVTICFEKEWIDRKRRGDKKEERVHIKRHSIYTQEDIIWIIKNKVNRRNIDSVKEN